MRIASLTKLSDEILIIDIKFSDEKELKLTRFTLVEQAVSSKLKQDCSYQGEALNHPSDCLLKFMEQ